MNRATEKRARRLAELAGRSATFAAFFERAQRFPAFYGFPGCGTRPDWTEFYTVKNKSLDNRTTQAYTKDNTTHTGVTP